MVSSKRGRKKKKLPKEKEQYYVSPKEFRQQLEDYYTTGACTEQIATSILKIATGLSYARNFKDYSYKEEMIGDAVMKMYTAVQNKKFDLDTNNNPFSYFTTIAFHAFINRIKKEKKYRNAVDEYQEIHYIDMLNEEGGREIYTRPDHYDGNDEG